ncbi:hypothetical protein RS405_003788 [Serratia marcescens]|nr:hypothetical protein [Serratia marcescens]ELJ5815896.1 hypothetical protein [Serratia marcescens]ELN8908736.1 hypothetical protein [Serratia marcescens]ELT0474596.1 hypothetical protein [Serratia marcescens]EMB2193863.1 hypothetical protein [Serratia marcescens]
MDSTLLGALIGAGAAIAGAIATSTITYFSNKSHDKEKTLSIKKESLYICLEDLKTNIHNNALIFGSMGKDGKPIITKDLDDEYRGIIKNIKMLVNIYFKGLGDEFNSKMDIAIEFYTSYAIHLRQDTRTSPLLITKELLDSVNASYDKSMAAIDDLQNIILKVK